MLLLKLIGNNRPSRIEKYDREPGLGVFAGLDVLPKPTCMSAYSCRCSQESLMEMQEKVVSAFSKRFSVFLQRRFHHPTLNPMRTDGMKTVFLFGENASMTIRFGERPASTVGQPDQDGPVTLVAATSLAWNLLQNWNCWRRQIASRSEFLWQISSAKKEAVRKSFYVRVIRIVEFIQFLQSILWLAMFV